MPRRKYGRLRKAIPAPPPEERCGMCRELRFCAHHGRVRRLAVTHIKLDITIRCDSEGLGESIGMEIQEAVKGIVDSHREEFQSGTTDVSIKRRYEYIKP